MNHIVLSIVKEISERSLPSWQELNMIAKATLSLVQLMKHTRGEVVGFVLRKYLRYGLFTKLNQFAVLPVEEVWQY